MKTEVLWNVINTLNCITVNGKDNLDMLLGCILTLESLAKDMADSTQEEVKDG